MWTFTEDGFFSTVKDTSKAHDVLVRTRDANSLARFCMLMDVPIVEIQQTPERDYPFRVSVDKGIWVKYLDRKAREIDYPDFKSHCKSMVFKGHAAGLRRRQIMTMGTVWAVMYDQWEERPDEVMPLTELLTTSIYAKDTSVFEERLTAELSER